MDGDTSKKYIKRAGELVNDRICHVSLVQTNNSYMILLISANNTLAH